MFRKVHRTNGLEGFIPSDLLTRSIQIGHATDGFEIEDGFAVALVAGRFDFFDGICQFQKATTPREQSGSEIAAQSVADHRHPFLVDHIPELIDVLGMEKLDFIDEDTVNPIEIVNFNSITITDDRTGKTVTVPIEGGVFPASAIREGDWKLIEYLDNTGEVELFNLAEDLGENQNLAGEKRGRVADLKQKLTSWRTEVGGRLPIINPFFDPAKAAEWYSLRNGQPVPSTSRKRFPPTERD